MSYLFKDWHTPEEDRQAPRASPDDEEEQLLDEVEDRPVVRHPADAEGEAPRPEAGTLQNTFRFSVKKLSLMNSRLVRCCFQLDDLDELFMRIVTTLEVKNVGGGRGSEVA